MFKFVNLFLMIFLLITIEISGQGAITGVVSDSATGGALYGANVFLTGTAFGSSTNIEGKFKISHVPSGKYNLKVSYIGFIPKEYTVTLMENKTLEINVKLKTSVIQGSEVVVSGQALGQAAAINQQLSSNTIVNIVSEEKIQELPDANAAEAIGRLPGVAIQREGGEANKVVLRGLSSEFSTITIDGVRISSTDENDRGTDLSMIAQGSLAGIELYKALTSDQDADAIAGSVNLVTKKAPSKRTIRFDTKGLYNKLDNSFNQYFFTIKYGERFFNNVLGVQVNGNLEKRIRSNENPSSSIDADLGSRGEEYNLTGFNLSYRNEVRKRNGLSLLIDINTPNNGSIKINNTYSGTLRNYGDYGRLYEGYGGTNAISPETYSLEYVEKRINSFNSAIIGKNHLLGFDLNWGFSFNQSISNSPYDYLATFSEITNIDPNTHEYISGTRNIPIDLRHGPPEALISYAVNNFNDAYMNNGTYYDERNIEKNRTFHLDILKEYALGETISGSFKFGGKYRVLNRSKNTNGSVAPYYNMSWPQYEILSDGSVVKKDLSGTDFENLKLVGSGHVSLSNFLGSNIETRNLFDLYSLNPLIDVNLIKEWYQLNKNGSLDPNGKNPEYRKDAQSVLDYYELIERIGAGYIMNTLRFSDFATFITGLRAENESNDYKSRYTPGDLNSSVYIPSSIKDTSSSFNELIWLPNFQLKIIPTSFMNIRLAAYKALARPDFNYRLLKYVGQSGTQPTVILGNPNLKAAKAWNYETSVSFYNNEIGLFTISGFYKLIKDMYKQTSNIQLQTNQGADAVLEQLGITWPIAFPRYGLTYAYNSPKDTKVWGFELSHQINFLYLPGLLSGIVLSYNVTISRSESYNVQTEVVTTGVFPNRKTVRIIVQDKGKLESQPELFGNVGFGYDIGGFSARVSVFFQNEYITSITGDGRDTHFQKGFTNWDIALKQRINNNIAVLFNINNFSDYIESSGIRNNIYGWEQINSKTKYGLTADLGVRFTL